MAISTTGDASAALPVRSIRLSNSISALRKLVLLSATVLLIWSQSSAQNAERAVTGVVTDKQGNTLSNAAVQLENTANLFVRSYITGKDGRYRFTGLNDDIDYTLRAKYRNYWSEQKTLSKFNTSKNPELNLVIPID